MTNLEIHDVEQRSDEWRALRVGKLTGTRAAAVLAGFPDRLQAVKDEMIAELRTGEATVGPPDNDDMKRGRETEDLILGLAPDGFETVGFAVDACGYLACSPDGWNPVSSCLAEVKSPRTLVDDVLRKRRAWVSQTLFNANIMRAQSALLIQGHCERIDGQWRCREHQILEFDGAEIATFKQASWPRLEAFYQEVMEAV